MLRVIVVGGTKGIGEATVARLRKDGAAVIPMARSNGSLDLAWDDGRISAAVHEAVGLLGGGLDRLVLSGGMGAYVSTLEMDSARVDELWRTNFGGPVQVYRAALRSLLRARGKVLWIGSTVATHGARGLSAYAATKAAVDGFVRSEARTLAKHHVAMNVLSPGWVETPMTAEIKPEIREAIVRSIPMRRMAYAAEIAEVAVGMLAWPHWCTGGVHEVTGGA